ncbi:hypothetical protein [Clostridium sp.]|uniref:hypothetical protein n=1 Tax=Clostridium sp. TaxID=1506 RepID=UPI00262B12EB|nr:hypothetical protein [Clostridium sp.]
MVMKQDGRERRRKTYIKCDKCKERFEYNEEDIIKYEGISYLECPCCSQEIILKK